MKTPAHAHRRRFYVRKMYNSLHKLMAMFRKEHPKASVEELKLAAFKYIIALNRRSDIAMMPIAMTETTPARVAIEITNPERPGIGRMIVAI